MRRAGIFLVCLPAFALMSGCTSSRQAAEAPDVLEEVNQRLEGRWARIQTIDGDSIDLIENVQIGFDSTTYHRIGDDRRLILATETVAHVSIRERSGVGFGALIGAAPGFIVATWGASSLAANSGAEANALLAYYAVAGGLVMGVIGAIVGAVTVGAATPDYWRVLFTAPVGRYRQTEDQ